MNTGTTIIGAVITAMCILPFLIMGYFTRKRKTRMLRLLSDYAATYLCKISKYDIARNMIVGTDEISKCLFFCKTINEKSDKQHVELKDIRSCIILSDNHPMKYSDGNYGAVEKLELSFLPVDGQSNEVKFEFFNSEHDLRLTTEMQLAEKWQHTVNEMLRNKKKK